MYAGKVMKRIIVSIPLLIAFCCISIQAADLYSLIDLIHNQPVCLPTVYPDSFGRTHFIVGFPHEKVEATRKAAQQKPIKKSLKANAVKKVLFSPDDNLQQALIEYINNENKQIRVAIFCFTDKDIAQALIDAHNRGIDVEIVTDPAQLKDRYSKMSLLQDSAIKVYEYNPNYVKDMRSNIMHHKFVIFGRKGSDLARVWTGSFNFTQAANKRNQENVLISADPEIVEKFCEQFELLKKRCVGCHPKRVVQHNCSECLKTSSQHITVACAPESKFAKNGQNKRRKIA